MLIEVKTNRVIKLCSFPFSPCFFPTPSRQVGFHLHDFQTHALSIDNKNRSLTNKCTFNVTTSTRVLALLF